jgi:hypothetical protein
MGLLIKKKLIPEKEFLERYWRTIVDCRWLLESDIANDRAARDYEDYVKNFDDLRDRACKYAEKKGLLNDKLEERCRHCA